MDFGKIATDQPTTISLDNLAISKPKLHIIQTTILQLSNVVYKVTLVLENDERMIGEIARRLECTEITFWYFFLGKAKCLHPKICPIISSCLFCLLISINSIYVYIFLTGI